jgi:hypothetical protein
MLMPVAFDEQSGVQRIEWRERDGAWQTWDGQPLSIETIERQVLRLRAIDQLDQVSPELLLVLRAAP